MTKDLDVQPAAPLSPWLRVRRFFHFEGKLGGVGYEARLGIFELKAPDTPTAGTEIVVAPEKD